MRILSFDGSTLYELEGRTLGVLSSNRMPMVEIVISNDVRIERASSYTVARFNSEEEAKAFLKKVVAILDYDYECIIVMADMNKFVVKSGRLYSELYFQENELGFYTVKGSSPIKGIDELQRVDSLPRDVLI